MTNVNAGAPKANVSLIIRASPVDIYFAFVKPEQLTRFWLSSSSAELTIGTAVHWEFMVKGAAVDATATKLEQGRSLAWNWSDGTTVDITLEECDGATAVTVINAGFKGDTNDMFEAALNATEGFSLVLADLKTLLESGKSSSIVKDKARLIELNK